MTVLTFYDTVEREILVMATSSKFSAREISLAVSEAAKALDCSQEPKCWSHNALNSMRAAALASLNNILH